MTFNRTAAELGFVYRSIEFEAEFTIDIRGRLGNERVRPHFQTVRVQARTETGETEGRLREVVEETERRRPVFTSCATPASTSRCTGSAARRRRRRPHLWRAHPASPPVSVSARPSGKSCAAACCTAVLVVG